MRGGRVPVLYLRGFVPVLVQDLNVMHIVRTIRIASCKPHLNLTFNNNKKKVVSRTHVSNRAAVHHSRPSDISRQYRQTCVHNMFNRTSSALLKHSLAEQSLAVVTNNEITNTVGCVRLPRPIKYLGEVSTKKKKKKILAS